MKLTKAQIKQIIKEELEKVMKEIDEETLEEQEGAATFDRQAAIDELNAKMSEPMTKQHKMKIKIKKKQSLDEMNAMSAGSIEGVSGPFGDADTVTTFNKKQEREQRLKGSKLIEMFSTSGIAGRNMQISDDEETFEGHKERSE